MASNSTNATVALGDTGAGAGGGGGGGEDDGGFEKLVSIIFPTVCSLITLIGVTGNVLVIVVVWLNKQMRNTTNMLIINLAVADLLFIGICVPFTALIFALSAWPFGIFFCKVYRYSIHVTATVSVYTLVLMSLDRYLAVVHPISSITYRTIRNCLVAVLVSWAVTLASCVPLLLNSSVIHYWNKGENRSTCIDVKLFNQYGLPTTYAVNYHVTFFVLSFVLPLLLICFLYGRMLHRLIKGSTIRTGSASDSNSRTKRRVTRMVVAVVAMFAACWLPWHLIHIVRFSRANDDDVLLALSITFNGLAYVNSCVNPLLYAFLSEPFRRSFQKLLCDRSWQPVPVEPEAVVCRSRYEMSRSPRACPAKCIRITSDEIASHVTTNDVGYP